MIRGCAIILGTFLGVLPDFGVSFWIAPGFLGIFLDCLQNFGYHFLVKFICLEITHIFGY